MRATHHVASASMRFIAKNEAFGVPHASACAYVSRDGFDTNLLLVFFTRLTSHYTCHCSKVMTKNPLCETLYP